MSKHALLSPSSAARWLQCTPSARLEAKLPDRAGEAADEGTLAHKLSEILLKHHLKLINKITFLKELTLIKKNKLYTPAMMEYCEQFKAFVLTQYSDALKKSSDACIFLEQEVDLSHLAKNSYGTRDIAIVADHILDITDLKYGKGIKVSAVENKQMMLYALGTLAEFDMLFDIRTVRMTIFQPRIDNYDTWTIDVPALIKWAKDFVIPKAKLAYEGKGIRVAGEHCTFCKVKNTCAALSKYNLSVATHEFASADELTDKELVDIFKKASAFKTWINGIEDYMLKKALSENKKWPGLKLVAGRSTRSIANEAKAIQLLKNKKIRSALFLSAPSLLGLTALEKNIGLKELNKIIGRLIIKPGGKPTLVDITDPRNEYHSAEAAKKEFSNFKNAKRKTK